jgi:DNA-binding NarL/FixJ family response regulator
MNKIKVVIIDDQELNRVGLAAKLATIDGIEVLGEAGNKEQGLKLIKETLPDVVVLDIGLATIDEGIELTQSLKKLALETNSLTPKVVVLTEQDHQDSVLAAFVAGADSYILKDASVDDLIQAINVTYEGNSWIDPNIASLVLQQFKKVKLEGLQLEKKLTKTTIEAIEPEYQAILANNPLSDRELEVLELIVSGYYNAQIAEELYITVGTVKTHVRSILNKLCVDDRTQAAVTALRAGLVD